MPTGENETNHLKTVSKTDDEIRVGNYMVLFGGKDLYNEYFTPQTKFDSEYTRTGTLYVDWEHGLDYNDPVAPQRDDILGYVDWKTAKTDEKGLWVERVLSRRNEYIQYLEALIEEGWVGTSSEAVGSKVRKKADGEIQMWPLKRDALTVQPAEPRMMTENAITAIKALSEFNPNLKALLQSEEIAKTGEDGGKVTHIEVISQPMEGNKMTDEIKVTGEEDPGTKALIEQNKKLSDQVDTMLGLIKNSPQLKDAGYVAPDSETDHPEAKSLGDFLLCVQNDNRRRLSSVYKTAMAEGAGATGGYMVPDEWGGQILEFAKEFNALRRAGATVEPMAGRYKDYWVLDVETAPSAGDTAYAGGAIAYWTEEAASITESEPRFRNLKLEAHELNAYAIASNTLREDAGMQVDNILSNAFAKAIGSKEEYSFFRGDGVGKPAGIMGSGALIAETRHTTLTVALTDLAVMASSLTPDSWNSAAWFMNPTCLDQLIQLVTAPLSFLGNLNDDWRGFRLLGRPLFIVGCLPTLGTQGDFMLIDPKYYVIGDRKKVSIAYSEHFLFQTNQAAWRATSRVDGQPIINNAITLEDATNTVSPFIALTTV